MIKMFSIEIALLLAFLFGGCQDNGTGWTPDMIPDEPGTENPDSDDDGQSYAPISTIAPLYWSVYEYAWVAEQAGVNTNMPEITWDKNIAWVADNLLPYGYNMICTDGFMSMTNDPVISPAGYMTHYAGIKLSDLIGKCKAKGLRLGIYDNPLWVHCPYETVIKGTEGITVGSLLYNSSKDDVLYPDKGDSFTWIVPSHEGAKEFIDGFFKYYKSIGVEFIRMDFLCLFETADGAGGMPGRGYGREEYELALKYIHQAATKYQVFTSLVMPNLKNDAELEKQYGNMIRVDSDTMRGGWQHFASNGPTWFSPNGWPSTSNMFTGLISWSHISGRGKVVLDADFTRLNTFDTADEKQSVISLQLMAGGPIAVADQYNTIADGDLKYYQNEELLALNKDGFVGKPLSGALTDWKNQVWYGKMSNGDYVVGFFNKEEQEHDRTLDFSEIGLTGKVKVRDLWTHQDEGEAEGSLSYKIAGHACKIVKLTKAG